jgi:hypothetical protein
MRLRDGYGRDTLHDDLLYLAERANGDIEAWELELLLKEAAHAATRIRRYEEEPR